MNTAGSATPADAAEKRDGIVRTKDAGKPHASWWTITLVLGLCLAALIARRPDLVAHPQFWAAGAAVEARINPAGWIVSFPAQPKQ